MTPGVEFYLQRLSGLAPRAEYVRGYYLPINSNTNNPGGSNYNPYGSTYNDVRVRLTWSKTFGVGRGE